MTTDFLFLTSSRISAAAGNGVRSRNADNLFLSSFLGTHYLSEGIAGAFTGILASVAVYFAYTQGSRVDKFLTDIF